MRFHLAVVKMVACAAVVGALGAAPEPADALIIPAVVGADSVDASPANGVCEAPCTLRRAVQTANGSAGPDTITLGAGTYQLGIAGGNEDAAATGDLDVTAGNLTITGAGASSTIVDGEDSDRVFDVRAGIVAMSGMTIRDGHAAATTANPAFGEGGGGIRTAGDADVSVTDATITNNSVRSNGHGGGTASEDTSTLTLTRVGVTSNEASELPGGGGGGGVAEEAPGVVVKIIDSTVSDNESQFAAGVWDDGTGRVEITRSSISDNHTVPEEPASPVIQSGGGVVEGAGTVVITDSVISGNTATYGAGVIDEGGTLTITNSTISGNRAPAVAGNTPPATQFPYSNGVGGGLLGYGGGAITITDTTLSGNSADLNGGAMAFQTAGAVPPAQFVNSTIADNSAGTAGGAARLDGSPALSFTNTTIDGNTAPTGAALNICSGGPALPAGYCDAAGAGTITLRNSIVSGGSSANCARLVGAISSAGNSLDSGNSCGFGAAGDKVNADPLLGGLAFNGGNTRTKALQDGSPAIDSATACPATDQRGSPRPFGPLCDMGAFEGGVPRTAAAAAPRAPTPQCGDGRDNDSDGAVDGQDPGCQNASDANEGDENLGDLILCGRRQISLVRADAKGRTVALSGLVSKANSGKTVTILANYGTRGAKGSRFTALKTIRAKSNGEFSVSVKGPSRRLFAKARFQARVGRSRSVALKLPQSLASSSIRRVGANVVLRGTVKRSLLGKRNPISIRRLVCGRYQTVSSAKPDRRGRYTARFRVPALSDAALYRAESRVLAKPGSKRYVKQFARAVGIAFKSSR